MKRDWKKFYVNFVLFSGSCVLKLYCTEEEKIGIAGLNSETLFLNTIRKWCCSIYYNNITVRTRLESGVVDHFGQEYSARLRPS